MITGNGHSAGEAAVDASHVAKHVSDAMITCKSCHDSV